MNTYLWSCVCVLLAWCLAGCGVNNQSNSSGRTPTISPETTTSEAIPELSPFPTRFPTPTVALVRPVGREFYWQPARVEQILAELQRTDLPPDVRASLEQQLWMEDLSAIQRATSTVLPTPTPDYRPSPTPDPNDPALFRGIREGDPGIPPSSMNIYIHNTWYDIIEGYRWTVRAGADREDTTQGVLSLTKAPANVVGPTHFDSGRYLAPGKTGYLRVTRVDGMLMHVVAEDGTTYTFDLEKRTFGPGE